MTLIKKIAVVAVALVLLVQSVPAASAATTAELEAQLQQLLVQLAALQAQLPAYVFTRDLTVGSRGDDVKKLQEFLIAQRTLVLAQTTTYFGNQTKAALAKWQAQNGISPAAGYFGPVTRKKVNEVIAAQSGTQTPGETQQPVTKPIAVAIDSSVVLKFPRSAAGKVNIYLCTGTTSCNTLLASNYAVVKGENSYLWTAPAGTSPSNYSFKIVDATNASDVTYVSIDVPLPEEEQAQTPATQQPGATQAAELLVTTPVATAVGSLLSVKFTSNVGRRVTIRLCSDPTTCLTTITAGYSVSAGNNSYLWAVPASVVPGQYVVQVKADESAATAVSQLFSIAAGAPGTSPTTPTSTTSTPAGNATFVITQPATTTVGSLLPIKFTSSGAQKVNIYLCTSTTNCATTITSGSGVIDGSNTYSWMVATSTTAGQYYLKVANAADTSQYALTATTFMIGASAGAASTLSGSTPEQAAKGTGCSVVSGSRDYKTTCGKTKALISGLCFYGSNPIPAIGQPHMWLDGMGVICSGSSIKLYCCGL